MRFWIEVDEQWRVRVRRPGSDFETKHRMLSCAVASGATYPLPPGGPGAVRDLIPGDDPAATIARLHQEIRNRGSSDTRIFGRYLFDCLLGETLWLELVAAAGGEELLELALDLPPGGDLLRTLPWEMMHGPEGFLAAARGQRTAITRLQRGASGIPRTFRGITRMLFVIGTSLDEREIRPGAEFLGLLRQLEHDGNVLCTRVLERASAERLQQTVASFRPDVVHFICHGGIDFEDRGYLELVAEDTDEPSQRNAEQILGFLRDPEGELPSVVVLSACESGSLLAPEKGVSLAAELVAEGIPVVVGMAGRVADRACRLFTRRFGQALIRGESLVAATEEGRRAAFAEGESPRTTVDWAFPSLFLSPEVPSDYAPADARALRAARRVAELLRLLDVQREPVFCGRHGWIEELHHLLEDESRAVLLVLAREPAEGVGKTRLLLEMAAHALMAGYLPVLLKTESPDRSFPRDALALGLEISDQIYELRTRVLGLGEGDPSDLERLASPGFDPSAPPADLPRWMHRYLRRNEISPKLVRRILEKELDALVIDARAEVTGTGIPIRGAVVFLDDVDQYDKAQVALVEEMLDPQGLGSTEHRVPVVATLSTGATSGPLLGRSLENLRAKRWVRSRSLQRFRPGEDMLAYERVLLHPFLEDSDEEISKLPWQMDFDAPSEVVERYEKRYRSKLQQAPTDFTSERFFLISDFAREDEFLRKADDEVVLRRMRGEGP